jgi:hypothetical protein
MKSEEWEWIELVCWLSLPIMIVVRLVNGPSVSDDQMTMRSLLIVIAIVGILYCRWQKLVLQ